MALGSWRTFERMSRDDGVAVMLAARDAGIDFLDDARYNDETGTAPIPTGYSEVVFGELFRLAGWRRDDVTVSNKLWWEHWPSEDAAAELDGSLARMGLDRLDLIYAIHPPDTLPIAEVVGQVGGLLQAGKARAWGTGMWSAGQLAEALDVCDATGTPRPVAAQMACSLADHADADDPAMLDVLGRGPIGLVAAFVLAGGALTGKYLDGTGRGRADHAPLPERGRRLAASVVRLAEAWASRLLRWPSASPLPTRGWPACCSVPPARSRSPRTSARWPSSSPSRRRRCARSWPSATLEPPDAVEQKA